MSQPARHDVLRFITAGSVDDGKSTLIGRLLYDTKTIFEDQLEHVVDASRRRGTRGSTSRYSPMAYAPSVSRASRSTSPTATSPPRAASSSSPTHLATRSTPETWSRARALRISPSCSSTRGTGSSNRRDDTPSSHLCWGSTISCSRSTRWTWSTSPTRRSSTSETNSPRSSRVSRTDDVTFIPTSALSGTTWWTVPMRCLGTKVRPASASGDCPHRLGSESHRRPNAGAVGDSAAVRRERRLSRRRGPRRQRSAADGGRSRRAAGRPPHPHRANRAVRGTRGRGRPPMAATVHRRDDLYVSRGDMLCRPGTDQRSGKTSTRWSSGLARNPSAKEPGTHSSTPRGGWSQRHAASLRAGRGEPSSGHDGGCPASQRHRSSEPPRDQASVLRPLSAEPTTLVHPRGRDDTGDRGRGHAATRVSASTLDAASNGLFVVHGPERGADEVAEAFRGPPHRGCGRRGVQPRSDSLEGHRPSARDDAPPRRVRRRLGSPWNRAPIDDTHTIAGLPKRGASAS